MLQKLPPDMAEFYERMANDVHKITSPTNRILAVSIITIVTCAFRVLTVAELSQLLSKENGMLDVSRTVAELCGGFVVVDNEENVTLIHQTAREYLLDTEHVLLRVDTEAGNKKLLIGCLQTMMTIGLRENCAKSEAGPSRLCYSGLVNPSSGDFGGACDIAPCREISREQLGTIMGPCTRLNKQPARAYPYIKAAI